MPSGRRRIAKSERRGRGRPSVDPAVRAAKKAITDRKAEIRRRRKMTSPTGTAPDRVQPPRRCVAGKNYAESPQELTPAQQVVGKKAAVRIKRSRIAFSGEGVHVECPVAKGDVITTYSGDLVVGCPPADTTYVIILCERKNGQCVYINGYKKPKKGEGVGSKVNTPRQGGRIRKVKYVQINAELVLSGNKIQVVATRNFGPGEVYCSYSRFFSMP